MSLYRVMLALIALVGFLAAIAGYYAYRSGGFCPSDGASDIGIGGGWDSGGSPIYAYGGESSGCERLYGLEEARIFGLHFSSLALVYFSILLVASFILQLRVWPHILYLLLILYVVGSLVVPYLVWLEIRERSICPYCTVMYASILSGLIVASVYIHRVRNVKD